MVGAPGGQGSRFPPERAADFLKPQEIPVERERAIQVFHVKHHMPQVLRLHFDLAIFRLTPPRQPTFSSRELLAES
jgi:hypothetical protein